MFRDFIMNGRGEGPVGSVLQGCQYDQGLLRPYYDENGDRCVTMNTGKTVYSEKLKRDIPKLEKVLVQDLIANGISSPVFNALTLRKQEWTLMDQAVLRATRQRTRAWADLAKSETYGGFDGMSTMILEHETMSDPGEAFSDMDTLTEARNDTPKFQLEGLPLPITHAGFWFSSRRMAVSRNSGKPLDTTLIEASTRRVVEVVEKTTIGVSTGLLYGTSANYSRNSQVYGYTNFPARITKTDLTAPTGSNPEVTVSDVLTMRDSMYNAGFYGPFMIYHSTDWDKYLDNDYARLGGNNANMTLRDRLRGIEGINDVRRLDFLTAANSHAFTMIMVQMTGDVARAVNGMNMSVVQWESNGGSKLNFKVMCIWVPQLRADINGNCGILHARTP